MSGETDKNSVQSNEHPRPLATLNKFINYQSLSNGGQYRKRGRRRLFRCPYCPQTYVRKPWLTMHTLKKHRDELPQNSISVSQPAQSPVSTKPPRSGLAGLVQLSEHLIRNKKDATMRKLSEDAAKGKVQPLACSWCEQTFPDATHLRNHATSVHGKFISRTSSSSRGGWNVRRLRSKSPSTIKDFTSEEYESTAKEVLSGRSIVFVDLSNDLSLIDDFYREQGVKQEEKTPARIPGANKGPEAVVEVSEVVEGDAGEVLKPESPQQPPPKRRRGRPRKVPLEASATPAAQPASETKTPVRRRRRRSRAIPCPSLILSEKRPRKIPRGWEDFETPFNISMKPESSKVAENEESSYLRENAGLDVTYDEDSSFENAEKADNKSGPIFSPKDGSVSCFICGLTYRPGSIEAHVRYAHKRFPKDQCFICGKLFSTVENARVHVRAVHFGDSGSLHEESSIDNDAADATREITASQPPQELRDGECRCVVCQCICQIPDLKKHVAESHRSFPKTRCYFCGRRYSTPHAASEHMETIHLKKSLFTCPECEKNFGGLQEWREHLENIHQRDTLYKCEHCGKAFGWKKFLRQHVREEHVGDGSGSVFGMRNSFRAERTTLQEECDRQQRLSNGAAAPDAETAESEAGRADEVAKEAPEEGEATNFEITNSSDTSKNAVMEYEYELSGSYGSPTVDSSEATGDESRGQKKAISIDFFAASSVDICPICKKILHTKKSLKTHIEAIHQKMKRYACDLCDRSFYARCDLRKHIDCVHNRLKSYSCNECGRRFFLHSQLAAHLINHHKAVLPFKCNECGRRYAIRQVLNDHIWRFHTDKPKRIRINGRLVTPNPATMSQLQQASPPVPTQLPSQALVTSQLPPTATTTTTQSVEPTELAILGGGATGLQEVYLIGNQLYFAENVSLPATSLETEATQVYEAVQLEGANRQAAVTFQPTQTDAVPMHNGENQIIELDMASGGETIIRAEDLDSEQRLALGFDKSHAMLTTTPMDSLDANGVVIQQLPLALMDGEASCKVTGSGDANQQEVAYLTYQQSF
uniref:C2H2-type domain-containing protein n=1 Tax=Mesocestoides corti TaxID=53468 RepID=A0A5K3ETF7_MESCO